MAKSLTADGTFALGWTSEREEANSRMNLNPLPVSMISRMPCRRALSTKDVYALRPSNGAAGWLPNAFLTASKLTNVLGWLLLTRSMADMSGRYAEMSVPKSEMELAAVPGRGVGTGIDASGIYIP